MVKKKGRALCTQAAELKALEGEQDKLLKSLKDDKGIALNAAKKAKADDNEDLAMTQLAKLKELDIQIKLCEENIATAEKQRTILETKITKVKNAIATYEIKVKGIEARKKTNAVLKTVNPQAFQGDDINSIIEGCESKVSADETKLEYMTELSDVEEEDYSDELKAEFDKL